MPKSDCFDGRERRWKTASSVPFVIWAALVILAGCVFLMAYWTHGEGQRSSLVFRLGRQHLEDTKELRRAIDELDQRIRVLE